MDQQTSILFEHYRDSNALTGGLRRERNRFFVYLLVALAVGLLLAFDPEASARFLTSAFAAMLNLPAQQVGDFLPYHVLDGLLLAVVFFFLVNLYQRSVLLLNYYGYIALIEAEIRTRMQIPEDSVAFTREGSFYWRSRPILQGVTKYFYALIIGAALGLYLVKKVMSDWSVYGMTPPAEAGKFWDMAPLIVDAVIGLPILIIFAGYVVQSISLDKKPNRGEVVLAKKPEG